MQTEDIPAALHRLIVRACAEHDVSPYFWQIDTGPMDVDQLTARGLVWFLAESAGFTFDQCGMTRDQWRHAATFWRALDIEARMVLSTLCEEVQPCP